MDASKQTLFAERWGKYFPGAELPITFYYTDKADGFAVDAAPQGHRCFIASLATVRNGKVCCFEMDSLGCDGAKRYLGFCQAIRPNFEEFLSCGIPGQLEGERYKKTPELVREIMAKIPFFDAPAPYIVFKRWDLLEAHEEPEVVIFFASADVLSGLFTLANFAATDPNAVICPFGAGCSGIVQYPYLEQKQEEPRGVLGMFDVSARPWVKPGLLTFAAPMRKFTSMIDDMEESFLITQSWNVVRRRLD